LRSFDDPAQAIQIAAGETFEVRLAGNPTTGYTWQANANHQFKVGGEYTRYKTRHHEVYASPGNIYKNQYLVRPTYSVAYAQDKIEYSGMVVNAGLRLDLFDPAVQVPSDVARPRINALPAGRKPAVVRRGVLELLDVGLG